MVSKKLELQLSHRRTQQIDWIRIISFDQIKQTAFQRQLKSQRTSKRLERTPTNSRANGSNETTGHDDSSGYLSINYRLQRSSKIILWLFVSINFDWSCSHSPISNQPISNTLHWLNHCLFYSFGFQKPAIVMVRWFFFVVARGPLQEEKKRVEWENVRHRMWKRHGIFVNVTWRNIDAFEFKWLEKNNRM
jgi:hypothetical protein